MVTAHMSTLQVIGERQEVTTEAIAGDYGYCSARDGALIPLLSEKPLGFFPPSSPDFCPPLMSPFLFFLPI